jgi:tagatose 6-phosphate kinase
VVDAQGVQLRNAVAVRPLVVKINRNELAAVAGSLRGAEWLVVSDGARRVTVDHAGKKFIVSPPRVKAVNPIGSGDAMLAGIAVALVRGATMPEAIRWGVACGAANTMTAQPGMVRLAEVRRLRREL